MTDKLISIIIPTYNRASEVDKAIRSAQNQTYPNKQIIIIDDGSEDDTAQVVARFEGIEYYRQENRGQAAARNLGLKHAKGEYIASLDSDDVWQEDFLEVAVAALEWYETDFVFLNWTEICGIKKNTSGWTKSNLWKKYRRNPDEEWMVLNDKELRELFVDYCPAPSSSLLIRHSSIVSLWNEEMIVADDWYLILEMILTKKCRAAFTMTPFWVKHVHHSNIYHGREQLFVIKELGLHDEPIFARDFCKYLTHKEKAVLKKRECINHFNLGRLLLKHEGICTSALHSIFISIKFNPFVISIYIIQMSFHSLRYKFQLFQNRLKDSH